MIKCPNCSGEMEFSPSALKVTCKYCGEEFEPDELLKLANMQSADAEKEDTAPDTKEEKTKEEFEGMSYKCTQCGATLMTFDNTAVTFCSYCGSQAMLEDKLIKQTSPDFVIPFKKTREECIEAYKEKISKFKFLPDYMKDEVALEHFRGIYMPYCIYNLKKKGDIYNNGEKSRRSGDYIYYSTYRLKTFVDVDYNGISFDLSSKFFDYYSTSIPFNFTEAVEFNPSYLVGYYADTVDVEKTKYLEAAKKIADPDMTKRLKKDSTFSRYGCSSPKVSPINSDFKIGMFPTYFMGVRNKNNTSIHYAVVNGQTGDVAMDLPIDFKKYIGFSLILAVIIYLILNFVLVLRPDRLAIFSVIAAILCLVTSNKQYKLIKLKQQQVSASNKEKPRGKSAGLRLKQILSILLPIFALLSQQAADEIYYGAAIISLVLIIWSFKDLVVDHNKLASNKLPQLEKRGGDLSE